MPQKGRLRPLEERRPHYSYILQGAGAQGPTRCSLVLPSPSFPEARAESRLETRDRRERHWRGPEPVVRGARGQGSPRWHGLERTGLPGPRGWQRSPRHAQTVKAGQGEGGGGSLGFYLRCNSLAEDCS
jgi:hypothetical protein